ncbi:hypothetical protein ABBQ32_012984 [Trebouxia sp. C0010 RCD-2024]
MQGCQVANARRSQVWAEALDALDVTTACPGDSARAYFTGSDPSKCPSIPTALADKRCRALQEGYPVEVAAQWRNHGVKR